MHIKAIDIYNIRSLEKFNWSLRSKDLSGWHVLLGNNGSGKSSIIRSLSLSLIGPIDAQYLQQEWALWIQKNKRNGTIITEIENHQNFDTFESGRRPEMPCLVCALQISPINSRITKPQEINRGDITHGNKPIRGMVSGTKHAWGNGRGWFSASFGPYRRFTGGDPKYMNAYLQNPKAAPHISAFGEDAALNGALQWLIDQSRLRRKDSRKTVTLIKNIINTENFLPNDVFFHDVIEEEILFKDKVGNVIGIEQLGDGYRSALSITIELIHQLVLSFGIDDLTVPDRYNEIVIPGVVIIDEVDAHLHPTWQQKIGKWLTSRFPEMQFIVTTHSPLICQAATTVYKLPTPGTDEKGRFLDDLELSRLRYGNIFEAYASEAFGKIDRSEEGKKKLDRLADLTRFSWERELTEEEQKEQAQLRAIFIDSPIGI
jgi:energy-coupling factor transporter ATP-binding protein EcfA2